jgi:hypothetical protein
MAALEEQVGGDHYKHMKIQPIEFVHANQIPGVEASIIKYICRHKFKNKREDLLKAKHLIDILLKLEYGYDEQE